MSDRYENDQACGIEPEIEGEGPTEEQWSDRCRVLWIENKRLRDERASLMDALIMVDFAADAAMNIESLRASPAIDKVRAFIAKINS